MCNCGNHPSAASAPEGSKVAEMVNALGGDAEVWGQFRDLANKADVSGIVALAARKGFDLNEESWRAYTEWEKSTIPAPAKRRELTEEDLESVAGGAGSTEESDECWLITAEWDNNNRHVWCHRIFCTSPNGYHCKCYKSYICGKGLHLLSVLDRNGKCVNQKGYIGGPPPEGSQ